MEFTISGEEKACLLARARETIAARLENRKPVYCQPPGGSDGALAKHCGAFVTLRTHGRLRGCIGRMSASQALEKTVQAMALEAAFGDPRFPPLQKEEFDQCRVEISVLSPLEHCPDPRNIKTGVHGLYLACKGRSGVLLPQVPLEQGWNLEQYLEHICLKTGVPPGSYKETGAELFTFTASVFEE